MAAPRLPMRGDGRPRVRLAAAAVLVAAVAALLAGPGVRDAAADPTARFLCDARAKAWEKRIAACPSAGTAYPNVDGWRDGVVVELSGFHPPKRANGYPITQIAHWWFGPDGTLLRGKEASIEGLNPGLMGQALRIQDGGVFVGRMATLPPDLIKPGQRYTVLFQALVPCDRDDRFCRSNMQGIRLPDGFPASLPPDPPFHLVWDDTGTRSQFAWARIEILSGSRPGIDPGVFSLTCEPSGLPCAAGSPFRFETRDEVRQLVAGGCITFSREGEPYPQRALLKDGQGNPVFRPKGNKLSGFGTMPGAGTWKAHFDCYGGPPVLFGEYVLREGPKPPPPPVPVVKLDLALSLRRKTLPAGYNAPYPAFGAAEVYPGMTVAIASAAPAGWILYKDPTPKQYDLFLDGTKIGESPEYDWGATIALPADLAEGLHRITLRASRSSYIRRVEFEGSLDVRAVGTPASPRLAVTGAAETDREAAAVLTDVPRGTEVASMQVIEPDGNTHRIEGTSAAAQGAIDLRFRIPLRAVWETYPGTRRLLPEREVGLKVFFRQRLSEAVWHHFEAQYPVRVGLVCRSEGPPRLDASPSKVVLRRGAEVSLSVAGFPCGDRVRILAEREGGETIDWAAEGRLAAPANPVPLDIGGDGAATVRGLEERVNPRKPEKLVFVARNDAGLTARTEVTVVPAAYIEVSPERPKAGDRIRIRAFGFKANAYVHVFLGEAPLTPEHGKPLDAVEPVEVRLLDGVAGRQTIRLVDNAGNQAEETIEIEGDGAQAACTQPCVLLPPQATQGERIDALIGGFFRNEKLVVRFADLFEVGKPYQEGLMVKQEVLLPRDLKDGRYAVTAYALPDPSRHATGEFDVAGGYRAPGLEIACPQKQPGCLVPRFAPGESLHTTGLGWTVKGRFRGLLIPGAGAPRSIDVTREGCLWNLAGGTPQGKPCDAETGEIDKFWALPGDLPAGDYFLEVTDGASSARAPFRIAAAPPPVDPPGGKGGKTPPPDPPPVKEPVDPVEPPPDKGAGEIVSGPPERRPVPPPPEPPPVKEPLDPVSPPPAPPPVAPPATRGQPCNPDWPKIWQEGCVEAGPGGGTPPPGTETGGPVSQPPAQPPVTPPATKGQPCNPDWPLLWQEGCVKTGAGGGTSAPGSQPPPQVVCDPSRPTYAQEGCVEPPPSRETREAPGAPRKCIESVPSYQQRGCIP